jgi:hypothetical protein
MLRPYLPTDIFANSGCSRIEQFENTEILTYPDFLLKLSSNHFLHPHVSAHLATTPLPVAAN